jgi:transposase
MDSTTIREIPPLRMAWAPIGQQACVPIIGSHNKRVLSGVMNILTGSYLPYVSASFNQGHFQDLLRLTRAQWRGWHIILFVDRASAHTADASQSLAADLHIALRWLPTACPELNVMDCLWRHVKDDVLANESIPNLEATVNSAISYLDSLTGYQRLVKAGVFSDNFWLANVRNALLSK